MRFQDQLFTSKLIDLPQGVKRTFSVVEHPEKQNDIEWKALVIL